MLNKTCIGSSEAIFQDDSLHALAGPGAEVDLRITSLSTAHPRPTLAPGGPCRRYAVFDFAWDTRLQSGRFVLRELSASQ
jgi:hypothetical protein